jgi:hypothetical protein
MCSENHPKFLSGSVLWSPDGWLRIIGHVCAAKSDNFGEARYRRMQREHEQKELDDAALDLMEANIAAIPPLRRDVGALQSAMEFMEAQQRAMFSGVPALATRLAEIARRGGGKLTIAREVSPIQLAAADGMAPGLSYRTPVERFEEFEVGVLSGGVFLDRSTKFPRSRQVESVKLALDMIPDGQGTDPLYKLIDAGGEHQITIVAITVLRAVDRALTLADDYANAAAFVSKENLDALEYWGNHHDIDLPFSIKRTDREIVFKLQDLSRARLSAAWPPIVSLSAWSRIAEAGATLASKARANLPP